MNLFFICFYYLFSGIHSGGVIADLQSKSAAEKKNIAVYFSGSDWCTNCHKFKSQTLQLPEVESVLSNNYIYYAADFPQRKKLEAATIEANKFLADKLNPSGEFPVLVITDSNWNVLAKIYKGNEIPLVMEKLNNHIHGK